MLFLLNNKLIDIGDPEQTLVDTVGLIGLRHERLTAGDAVEMGQDFYFRMGTGREPSLYLRRALASLLVLKLNANTAVFLVEPSARRPSDVKTQFAVVPAQAAGMPAEEAAVRPSSHAIHESVRRMAA